MIDPSNEELVPIEESRSLFPLVRRRRKKDDPSGARTEVGYATLMRLATKGNSNGIKLYSLIIAVVRFTSKEAVARYLRKAAEAEAGAPAETDKQRARRAAKAREAAQKALYPAARKPGRKP